MSVDQSQDAALLQMPGKPFSTTSVSKSPTKSTPSILSAGDWKRSASSLGEAKVSDVGMDMEAEDMELERPSWSEEEEEEEGKPFLTVAGSDRKDVEGGARGAEAQHQGKESSDQRTNGSASTPTAKPKPKGLKSALKQQMEDLPVPHFSLRWRVIMAPLLRRPLSSGSSPRRPQSPQRRRYASREGADTPFSSGPPTPSTVGSEWREAFAEDAERNAAKRLDQPHEPAYASNCPVDMLVLCGLFESGRSTVEAVTNALQNLHGSRALVVDINRVIPPSEAEDPSLVNAEHQRRQGQQQQGITAPRKPRDEIQPAISPNDEVFRQAARVLQLLQILRKRNQGLGLPATVRMEEWDEATLSWRVRDIKKERRDVVVVGCGLATPVTVLVTAAVNARPQQFLQASPAASEGSPAKAPPTPEPRESIETWLKQLCARRSEDAVVQEFPDHHGVRALCLISGLASVDVELRRTMTAVVRRHHWPCSSAAYA